MHAHVEAMNDPGLLPLVLCLLRFLCRALHNLGWPGTLYIDKASLILETRGPSTYLALLNAGMNERHTTLCRALYLIFRDKVTLETQNSVF